MSNEIVRKKRKSSGDGDKEDISEKGPLTAKRKKLYSSSSGSHLPDISNDVQVIPETPQIATRRVSETRSPEDIRQILSTSDKKTEDLSNRLLCSTETRETEGSPALSNKEVRKVRRDTMVRHAKLLEHKRLGQKRQDDFMCGTKSGFVHIDEVDIPEFP